MVPGAPAVDAPLRCDGHDGWLLRQLGQSSFTALVFDGPQAGVALQSLRQAAEGVAPLQALLVATHPDARAHGARTLVDSSGLMQRRFDGKPNTAYLLRPDQHVCARWRRVSTEGAQAALRRALALD